MCTVTDLLLLLLLKEVGSARLRESDIRHISPKTPAPQYQPINRKKKKEKIVEDYKVKSSMARRIPVENLLPQMCGQLSTTCSNVLKQPNGELIVAVNHNQVRTMASETVDPIDWSHSPP